MSTQLWDRGRVDTLKARSWQIRPGSLLIDGSAGPADALQAAREILGDSAEFSHINSTTGFLVYRAGGQS